MNKDSVLQAKLMASILSVMERRNSKLEEAVSNKLAEIDLLEGPIGATGPKGENGIRGEKGDRGEDGIQGPSGDKGDSGDAGPSGEKGDKGDPGAPGEKGEQGLPGSVGPMGERGATGSSGPPGSDGKLGLKGDTGLQGPRGLDGNVGPQGEKGEPGAKGDPGKDGRDGLDGKEGPKGRPGDKGADGLKGDKGDKGDPGKDGSDADVTKVEKTIESVKKEFVQKINSINQNITHLGGSAGSGSYSVMDQSDVVFKQRSDITDGSVLSYSTSLTKYVANNVIRNMDHIAFDLTANYTVNQGEIAWNADEETMDVGLNGAVLQMGQEIHYHVRNNSGVDINNGDSIMVTGTLGASGRLTVAKSVSNGSIPAKYFIGVATEDIPNDSDGKITHFGKVRGINTNVWEEGDLLYNDPTTPGGFVNVEPAAPNWKTTAAIVISKKVNGTILVRVGSSHTLNDLENVEAPSPANNDILSWNTDNSRWENVSHSGVGIWSINTITSNTALTESLITILVNANTANVYVTLPDATTSTVGRYYNIKKIDSSTNQMIIQGANTSQLIDGSTTIQTGLQYVSYTVQTDGSNWFII